MHPLVAEHSINRAISVSSVLFPLRSCTWWQWCHFLFGKCIWALTLILASISLSAALIPNLTDRYSNWYLEWVTRIDGQVIENICNWIEWIAYLSSISKTKSLVLYLSTQVSPHHLTEEVLDILLEFARWSVYRALKIHRNTLYMVLHLFMQAFDTNTKSWFSTPWPPTPHLLQPWIVDSHWGKG